MKMKSFFIIIEQSVNSRIKSVLNSSDKTDGGGAFKANRIKH